eukprot:CAMPEP_0117612322 /NCGR_PEP_ID=MMETSP0784-20121206/82891_1 /TAXON_ID=39447 /ORGANISM="" /LENGTH=392 /DNA_ID=CAMNT_0005415877 /DNA_START=76 /DNA_END=1255 /DNA_ORIENTATION=+
MTVVEFLESGSLFDLVSPTEAKAATKVPVLKNGFVHVSEGGVVPVSFRRRAMSSEPRPMASSEDIAFERYVATFHFSRCPSSQPITPVTGPKSPTGAREKLVELAMPFDESSLLPPAAVGCDDDSPEPVGVAKAPPSPTSAGSPASSPGGSPSSVAAACRTPTFSRLRADAPAFVPNQSACMVMSPCTKQNGDSPTTRSGPLPDSTGATVGLAGEGPLFQAASKFGSGSTSPSALGEAGTGGVESSPKLTCVLLGQRGATEGPKAIHEGNAEHTPSMVSMDSSTTTAPSNGEEVRNDGCTVSSTSAAATPGLPYILGRQVLSQGAYSMPRSSEGESFGRFSSDGHGHRPRNRGTRGGGSESRQVHGGSGRNKKGGSAASTRQLVWRPKASTD